MEQTLVNYCRGKKVLFKLYNSIIFSINKYNILYPILGFAEDGNGPKKAGVKRSRSSSAPSWVGHDSPPNSPPSPPSQQSFENQVRSEAEQEAQREACEYSRSYTNAYCSP
ncbi:hypothetical protein J1N35_042836 [Gossypium stocksii]|uniref:Uncharacterized protein n=1 Tax=Gossypium stocksii TaxID=47602 RepID=A0A9D3U6B3_9ROSI|nr:hypothetical protein J1N35_042836 [Gossypium stocksii]